MNRPSNYEDRHPQDRNEERMMPLSDDERRDPPLVQVECEMCDGEGHIVKGDWVYEHGCGFGHSDSYEVPCENCDGRGFFICEAEGD